MFSVDVKDRDEFVSLVLKILDAGQNEKPFTRVVNPKIQDLCLIILVFVNHGCFEASKLWLNHEDITVLNTFPLDLYLKRFHIENDIVAHVI